MAKKPIKKKEQRHGEIKQTKVKPLTRKSSQNKHKEPHQGAKKVRSVLADKTARATDGKGLQGRGAKDAKILPPTSKKSGAKGEGRCYYEPCQRYMTWEEIQVYKGGKNYGPKGLSPKEYASRERVRAVAAHLKQCKGRPLPIPIGYYEGLNVPNLTIDEVAQGWDLYRELKEQS